MRCAIGRTGGTERVTVTRTKFMRCRYQVLSRNGSPDDGAANGTRGLITFKSTQTARFIGDEGGERNGGSSKHENSF